MAGSSHQAVEPAECSSKQACDCLDEVKQLLKSIRSSLQDIFDKLAQARCLLDVVHTNLESNNLSRLDMMKKADSLHIFVLFLSRGETQCRQVKCY